MEILNSVKIRAGLLLLVTLALVTGCASRQYPSAPPVAVASQGCDDTFRQWQHQVEAGQSFDAQTWSPAGFPYLRVNRLLASFPVDELSREQQTEWLERAHALAVTAWHYEARSMGGNAVKMLPELERCGQAAISRLQDDERGWQPLEEAARVPASYNNLGRVLGAYPAVVPVVRWRAGVVMGELMNRFGSYQPVFPLQVYQPRTPGTPLDTANLIHQAQARSTLGIPSFTVSERNDLLARFAPTWVVETANTNDVPGRPGRAASGTLRFRPEPVVFSQFAYTRFDGQVLPQLVYTLWFPRRPADSRLDIVAGELDGLVWRVTLGTDGQPLIYDSMHPCGCYHTWVLAPGGLKPKGQPDFWEEPLWIAGTAPETDQGLVLHVASGTHYLTDATIEWPNSQTVPQRYGLEPYGNLRGPSFAGKRLFDETGMLPGTERLERFLLWPTGVPSAGAMRQWGQHATAFVGTRHFDDAFLLQKYFRH